MWPFAPHSNVRQVVYAVAENYISRMICSQARKAQPKYTKAKILRSKDKKKKKSNYETER